MREVGYFEILYKRRSNPIEIKRREGSLLGKKRIKKNRTQDASTIKRKSSSVIRDKFNQFCIVLAAWPSGKAGDCKSFFPSSNPGVAWSTKNLKSFLFCSARRIFPIRSRGKGLLMLVWFEASGWFFFEKIYNLWI